MAHSSINKHDVDWRREWDDEQQLTPEELRLQKLEQEENERIMEDMLACIREIEEREESRREIEEAEEYGYFIPDYDDAWDWER